MINKPLDVLNSVIELTILGRWSSTHKLPWDETEKKFAATVVWEHRDIKG